MKYPGWFLLNLQEISMKQTDDITAKIKDTADIAQVIGEIVELRKSGGSYLGLCPFHGEKTPSFSVNPEKQFFYCFGCHESGDVFSFIMKYYSLTFPEALERLAKKFNISLPEKRYSKEQKQQQQLRQGMYSLNKKAAEIYHRCLTQDKLGQTARRYLEKRGVSEEEIDRFGMGYAPGPSDREWDYLGSRFSLLEKKTALESGLLIKNKRGGTYDKFLGRILFPIQDISGQICGFGGRVLDDGKPKYMNSPESPIYNKSKLLLGLYQAKDYIRRKGYVIVVEGNFDMVSLAARGLRNVVAPLGTSLTREQIRLLKKFAPTGVLLFDGDNAGIKAAVRTVPHFLAEQFDGKVALLPEGHDPDTFVRERGVGPLNELLSEARELPEFSFDHLVNEHGLSLQGKSRIIRELKELLKTGADSLQKKMIVTYFADKLGLLSDELWQQIRTGEKASEIVEPPHPTELLEKRSNLAMSPAQRRLVRFMIFYPDYFSKFEEAGLRQHLEGTAGEIIFLHMRSQISQDTRVEPEELLTTMPEGPERKLVAGLLLQESEIISEEEDNVDDCLSHLQRFQLKKRSEELIKQIERLQRENNFQDMAQLLKEKQEIDRKIKAR